MAGCDRENTKSWFLGSLPSALTIAELKLPGYRGFTLHCSGLPPTDWSKLRAAAGPAIAGPVSSVQLSPRTMRAIPALKISTSASGSTSSPSGVGDFVVGGLEER